MNCAAADAFACDQARFNSSDILQKTMKTMDRTARLAMLPDHEIFCVDLTEGEYKKCSFFWFVAKSGADNICSALPAKDGSNKLKFYYIDLVKAIIRSAEDPTLAGKLYHTFEMQVDQEGNRVFEKANSGFVFESFYLLDDESAPLIGIVASDASHQGNTTQHPLYRKVTMMMCGMKLNT